MCPSSTKYSTQYTPVCRSFKRNRVDYDAYQVRMQAGLNRG